MMEIVLLLLENLNYRHILPFLLKEDIFIKYFSAESLESMREMLLLKVESRRKGKWKKN